MSCGGELVQTVTAPARGQVDDEAMPDAQSRLIEAALQGVSAECAKNHGAGAERGGGDAERAAHVGYGFFFGAGVLASLPSGFFVSSGLSMSSMLFDMSVNL
jgi:hypothetical protein